MTSYHTARAIVIFSVSNKFIPKSNYRRRMYAIIRRYTPNAVEGEVNECLAELTGLRTFFKMTYAELADAIRKDLTTELGATFNIRIGSVLVFEQGEQKKNKPKTVATYKEMNSLFRGRSFMETSRRKMIRSDTVRKRVRLSVPFIGKVR